MTPEQVARVLAAAHAKATSPEIHGMLEAAIAECEKISREQPVPPKSNGVSVASHPGGSGQTFPSDGVDAPSGGQTRAVTRRSTEGNYRVCVYFGTDEATARSFEAWVNMGGVSTAMVAAASMQHTQPQTAIKDNPTAPQPAIDSEVPSGLVTDPNPTQVYHHFEGKEENPLWCRHCDASEYAEQHI